MSLFEPSMAEQAALQERLRQLHDSAANGTGVTPMQALEERITMGDAKAVLLKQMILDYKSDVRTVCEKQPQISRAMTLKITAVAFHGQTLQAPKACFAAKRR